MGLADNSDPLCTAAEMMVAECIATYNIVTPGWRDLGFCRKCKHSCRLSFYMLPLNVIYRTINHMYSLLPATIPDSFRSPYTMSVVLGIYTR